MLLACWFQMFLPSPSPLPETRFPTSLFILRVFFVRLSVGGGNIRKMLRRRERGRKGKGKNCCCRLLTRARENSRFLSSAVGKYLVFLLFLAPPPSTHHHHTPGESTDTSEWEGGSRVDEEGKQPFPPFLLEGGRG